MDDSGGEKGNEDLYAILGLKKECSNSELRNAYKNLALKWHPDRCSASGNSMFIEEAKNKFQAIQQAYSVLSDTNKRFLYDVGVYDSDDENGMGDFLNEMATLMSQTKPNENEEESLEELQQLLEEMFEDDMVSAASSFNASSDFNNGSSTDFNKRNSFDMKIQKAEESFHFDSNYHNFSSEFAMEKLQDMKGKGGEEGGSSKLRR